MTRILSSRTVASAIFAAALFVAGAGVASAAFGFDDVEETDTHADGIEWLVNAGITAGCDADSYCPQQAVTRAQMATFMHRLSGQAGVAPSVDAQSVGGLGADDLVQTPAVVTQTATLTNDTFENVTATCAAGDTPIAGGFQIRASDGGAISDEWYAAASNPTPTGWTVAVRTLDGGTSNGFVTVWATCIP